MSVLLACLTVALATVDAAAQSRQRANVDPSNRIFERLFRDCRGCTDRPASRHLVMDSPLLTDAWLARHTDESNGRAHGDNAAIADLWYDAVHRRLFTRSLVLHEVADPADLRLGRAAGVHPNAPDFGALLPPGTTVGHVGFVRWSPNGFGAYFAAVQGAVRDAATGYLDFSTVTGEPGRTRTGSHYSGEDLIKHVRLHPSGQLEIGFETDPDGRPDPALLVRGNVEIEGVLTVGGSPVLDPPPPPDLACTVRREARRGRRVSVACAPGSMATGGGGACASGDLRGSTPIVSGDAASGWEIACSREGSHAAYVICCAR